MGLTGTHFRLLNSRAKARFVANLVRSLFLQLKRINISRSRGALPLSTLRAISSFCL